MTKIGFIGAGNMAGAIINGIVKGQSLQPSEIAVCDVSEEKLAEFSARGISAYTSVAALAGACKYLVLSVKPQAAEGVLAELSSAVTGETVIISIAAGITGEFIRKKIGFDCKLVLAMPNTPLLVGCGAVAVARIEPISDEEFDFAAGIFRQSGAVEIIPADRLNEVIPINGSSPAFIYLFAKIVCEYSKKYGFDVETSNRLFCNTLIGSAKMMLETGKSHDELIKAVCSPGGATLKGLEALEENGFERALTQCMDACIQRAYELGQK